MEIIKKYYACITGLIIFITYIFTLAPSVVEIDSGELAAVQATLGIAHPTGYPLFTLTGYLFLLLPLPISKIMVSNLLTALFTSFGVSFFIKSSKLILDNSLVQSDKSGNGKQRQKINHTKRTIDLSEFVKIGSSVVAGFILAFSKTFWLQSTSVEVYSLHILLMSCTIFLLLRIYFSKEDKTVKGWLSLSLILALGFSNHMTTLLIIPGIAYLYFVKEKFNFNAFKKIGLMLTIFFPLLALFYSYLPIRASQSPVLNWGNPVDFERFWRHFSGKQYHVWIFSSFDSAFKQLLYFIKNLPGEFAFAGLIFIVVGVVVSFKFAKNIFYFLIITFLSTLFYSINYDINDIDSYFLLAFISLSFFSLYGIFYLFQLIGSGGIGRFIFPGFLFLLLMIQFILNFGKVNKSGIYIYEDYSKAILNSTGENSVIFSYQWDTFISPAYYFQFVENYRKDAAVIDKELLRRSWYYDQLRNNSPEVVKNMQTEISNFLDAVKLFERGENFSPNLLENFYRQIMTNMISKNIEEREYYIGLELVENEMRRGEFSLPPGYTIVPHLFLFKVARGDEYIPAPDPDFKIRYTGFSNAYTDLIKRIVSTMLMNRAVYEMKYNKPERAKLYINKLKNDFPGYRIPETYKKIL